MLLDIKVFTGNRSFIVEKERTSVVAEIRFNIEACKFLS